MGTAGSRNAGFASWTRKGFGELIMEMFVSVIGELYVGVLASMSIPGHSALKKPWIVGALIIVSIAIAR